MEIDSRAVKAAREDLADRVSVVGWKEALDEKRTWTRHAFRIALLILSGFCLYYSYRVAQRWRKRGYDDEINDIPNAASLPFSNVTICAQVYFNRSFVKETIFVPPKLKDQYLKATGESVEEFYNQLTLFFSLIARPHSFTRAQLMYFTRIIRANPQMEDFSAFAASASLPCQQMLRRCWFGGREFDCCSHAIQSLDEDGICYLLALNFDSDNAESADYTVHQTKNGPRGGLTVEVSVPVEDFPWLEDDASNGFVVYVDAVPYSVVQSPLAASHAAETFIKVTPSKHRPTSNCARHGQLSMRGGHFMYYDPHGYSCAFRDSISLIRSVLDCEPPAYMYRPNSTMVCSPLQVYIGVRLATSEDTMKSFDGLDLSAGVFTSARKAIKLVEDGLKSVELRRARCPSHCQYWSYDSTASFGYLETDDDASTPSDSMYSKIHVYFGELRYRQHEEVREPISYLAFCDFGNVVELYWGMSVVSFVHVFFYVPRYIVIRWWARQKRKPVRALRNASVRPLVAGPT